jgi:hypothetical protein
MEFQRNIDIGILVNNKIQKKVLFNCKREQPSVKSNPHVL